MVGVIVIGVIAGIIATTAFAVIPWAQNRAAELNLGAVDISESAYRASSNDYFAYDSAADSDYRAAEKWSVGLQRPEHRLIVDVNSCYSAWIAAQRSASGAVLMKIGGDGRSSCAGTPPTQNNPTAIYKIAVTGPNANVIPAALTANLPSGIDASVPQALVTAITSGNRYYFGGTAKPGYVPVVLPTYAGESILGWTPANITDMGSAETEINMG